MRLRGVIKHPEETSDQVQGWRPFNKIKDIPFVYQVSQEKNRFTPIQTNLPFF